MNEQQNQANLPPEAPHTGDSSCGADNVGGYVRRLLILLLIVASAALTIVAMRLFCVVFAGVLLGLFLYRLGKIVETYTPLPYHGSVALVLVILTVSFVGLSYFFGTRVVQHVENLSSQLSGSAQQLVERMEQWSWFDSMTDEMPQLGGKVLAQMDATAVLGGVFSSAASFLTTVLMVLFIGTFLALDPQTYRQGFLVLVPASHRRRTAEVLQRSTRLSGGGPSVDSSPWQ